MGLTKEFLEDVSRVKFFYDRIANIAISKVNAFIDLMPASAESKDELLVIAAVQEMCNFLDEIEEDDTPEDEENADENEITKKIVNAISEIIGSKPEEIKIVKGDDKIAEVLNMIKKDTEAEKSDSSAAEALRKMLGV